MHDESNRCVPAPQQIQYLNRDHSTGSRIPSFGTSDPLLLEAQNSAEVRRMDVLVKMQCINPNNILEVASDADHWPLETASIISCTPCTNVPTWLNHCYQVGPRL